MASHRHNNCKLPPKDTKKRVPLEEHAPPKPKLPQKSMENTKKLPASKLPASKLPASKLPVPASTLPASKLPAPMKEKLPLDKTFNLKEVGGTEVHESNCFECSHLDNSNMVQCDECNRWAHFQCVGVGPEVEYLDWCCKFCSTTLSGLSLSDASSPGSDNAPTALRSSAAAASDKVRSSVATEAKSLNFGTSARAKTNDACLKLVKKESDLPAAHEMLDDKSTFEFYKEKLAKFGGTDFKETVREIGQQLISDEVLKNYSYLGRQQKSRFKNFDNLTKLVIASTVESVKKRYFEMHGKAMVLSDNESEKLNGDVQKYFTTEYIKQADTRFKRSTKRFF